MALTAFDDNLFAATRINSESTSLAVTACVVEPALIECQTMGFASFVLLTVDYLFVCNLVGRTILTVIWRNCFSGCSQDPNLNSWEWYFEPINQGIEAKARKVVCPIKSEAKNLSEVEPALRPIIDSSFRNRSCLRQFADTGLITVQERLRVNKWIKQYFKPNKNIVNGVDDFYRRHLAGNTLLGVHVRGTDRWGELPGGKLASLSDWVTQATLLFDLLQKPKKIFIASDNEEAIVAFLEHFGREKVAFTNAKRVLHYHDPTPIHFYEVPPLNWDKHQRALGTEVLTDVLLLAKCDAFLHTESSVAALASYFNPHMKSHFLEDAMGTCEGRDSSYAASHEMTVEEEKEEEENDRHECLQRNGPHSACPIVSKGKLVNLTMAKEFARW
ncbi:uncharacterized protein [Montipora foliosa]|uniref:uncharacterized protein n=1 Tax=Montipora foliosa TaxID=591990 RepID=UPI0035F175DA